MKALVISERSEIIDFVTPRLEEMGFDIIHYKWIIKALDNIEEIQPDVIVLSAGEYPRHWKTLAGFVQSGIGGNDVGVYLYETAPLSVDEEKKAQGLGVLQFTDFYDKFLKDNEPSFISVEVAYNEALGLMHFSSGKYFEEENKIELNEEITNVSYLKYISIYDGNNSKSFAASVEKVSNGITSLKIA